MKLHVRHIAIALLAAIGATGHALAQFPSRPITIIVPFAPGGGDLLARELIKPLSERLGQPVIVDTRGGGGGVVGTQFVMNSDPDGHRLLFHTSAAPMNQTLQKTPIVDVRKDLAPISLAIESIFGLYTTSAMPVSNLRELIDYVKANPGKLNYGSSGIGGSMHMIMEMVKAQAGLNITHVPYQGGTPAMVATTVNEVQMAPLDVNLASGQLQAGKLRLVGVLSPTRSAAFPNVPAVAEVLPGVAARYWWAFLAPRATPRPIIDRLHKEIVASLKQPDIEAAYAKRGFTSVASTPEELARVLAADVDKWTQVVKQANIPLQ